MWYGWDIIKGNYFMNERELLNHVFAEIIDKVNKLEAKKDKKGEVIQCFKHRNEFILILWSHYGHAWHWAQI